MWIPLKKNFLKSGKAPYSGKYREENSCFICFRTQALGNCTAYANKYFCRMQKTQPTDFSLAAPVHCAIVIYFFAVILVSKSLVIHKG